jgi:large subunit ribosomal protein L10
MNRDQKAAVIEQIAADIKASQAVFAVDYRGITVAQADALRARLRDCDASFRVVKNSLTERAADQAGAQELRPLLEGPTALTFIRGDAAAAAKAISDFARTTQLLAFKGGLMDGATLSAAEVSQISRLPSREVLYGQLVGLVASPIAGLARTLAALIGGLAVGLGGVLEQRGGVPADATPATADASEDAGGAESAQEAELDAPAGEADPAPQAEAESASEADSAAQAQTPAVEAEAEPGPEADPAPQADSAPQAQAPAVEAEAVPQPEADPAPEADSAAQAQAPAVAAEAVPQADGEADTTNELEEAGEPAPETDESKEN